MDPAEYAYWAEMRRTVRAAYEATKPKRKPGIHLGGRNKRCPPDVEAKVVELYKAGAPVTGIARQVGFSPRTVLRIMERVG